MNNHFDLAYLRKYVNGELSPSEMYALEKASHQDELLMDLILGLELEKESAEVLDKKDLDSAIYERTHPRKIRKLGYTRWISIAAMLLLTLGLGMIWFLNREPALNKSEELAADMELAAPVDSSNTNIAPIDSIPDELEEDSRIAMLTPKQKNSRVQEESVLEVQRPTLRLPEVPRAGTLKNDSFGNQQNNNDPIDLSGNWLANSNVAKKENNRLAGESNIVIRGIASKQQAATVGSTRMESAQDRKTIATGRVLDEKSGRPLAHVTVRDVKTNEVAVTDSSGQYIMPLSSSNQELELISLGYDTKRIIASNNKIVQLQPEMQNIDEVVIVGYGTKSAKIKSEPLVGWAAFKKYLNDQTAQSLAGKGSVTLVFDISSFGRPINISVKRSSNADLNSKAIQIIQSGPDWRLGNDGKKVEVKVDF